MKPSLAFRCPPTPHLHIHLLAHRCSFFLSKVWAKQLPLFLRFARAKTTCSCCGLHMGWSPPAAHTASLINRQVERGCECRVKAEEEDDEAEEERKIKKRKKQTGRTLYLAPELSPSVFLSWIIIVWQNVSCRAEVAGMHIPPLLHKHRLLRESSKV